MAVPDKGYSFCNCKNIWYTDWRNIEIESYYNYEYMTNHYRTRYKKDIEKLFSAYEGKLKELGNGGKKFLDLGCVVGFLAESATDRGYEVTGLDLVKRDFSKCKFIVADFDKETINEKFDVIWANHFFEHLHYPLEGLKKCFDMLNDGGLLFVAMPDPFMVAWDNPNMWTNWVLRQHYIMWDMDSFIEEAEKLGFKNLVRVRNFDIRPLRDYHLLFKK
jgi:2-polyprenyl-3-methyl-5-hydroxy-6-metoxy-1,4-benzoquinol methylase